jgi:hypothetical protein
MTLFQIHTIESAPKESQRLLSAVKQKLGFIPNLFGTFAESPAILEGYTRAHVLDVVLGVSFKTLSNYTNHLAHTELDKKFQAFAWNPESVTASCGDSA